MDAYEAHLSRTTTPRRPSTPEVAEAMLPFLREHFGNPSSSHAFGAAARGGVEKARAAGGGAARRQPGRGDRLHERRHRVEQPCASRGAAPGASRKGQHIVTSAVEHPAVREACAFLARSTGSRSRVCRWIGTGASTRRTSSRPSPGRTILGQRHARQQRGGDDPADRRDRPHGPRAGHPGAHRCGPVARARCPSTWRELGVDLLSAGGAQALRPEGRGCALRSRAACELRAVHARRRPRDGKKGRHGERHRGCRPGGGLRGRQARPLRRTWIA
ncbi:MAG: hypothetical protein MZV70_12955 [Desulfobacterales bacterium]|nr:hypothetical protein [Desulfobacterales bacterium]